MTSSANTSDTLRLKTARGLASDDFRMNTEVRLELPDEPVALRSRQRALNIRSIRPRHSWTPTAGTKMGSDPGVASSAVVYESRRRRPRQSTIYDFQSDAGEYFRAFILQSEFPKAVPKADQPSQVLAEIGD
jgi:hypothetical protein